MENKIYIANEFADKFLTLPEDVRERVTALIDSLAGNGWRNSQIVAPDDAPGGGLRMAVSAPDNLSVFFRHTAERNTIIVTSVVELFERQLASAS